MLAFEVQDMILNMVFGPDSADKSAEPDSAEMSAEPDSELDSADTSASDSNTPCRVKPSQYAGVSKRFQTFIEAITFKNIVLSGHTDVRRFKQLVRGRRQAYVKHVLLTIELRLTDDESPVSSKSAIVHRGWDSPQLLTQLLGLFTALSTWDTNHKGLTVELDMIVPSVRAS